jgi:TrmH family RNA methyltransferase
VRDSHDGHANELERARAYADVAPSGAGDGGDAGVGASGVITSKDNKWIKTFRAALQGGGPKGEEPIALEGPKLVEDAFRAGLEAEALLLSASGDAAAQRILMVASDSEYGIPQSRMFRTTDKLFESVSGTETPQGVAALFRQPPVTLEALLKRGAHRGAVLLLVLAGVQDPGNVGTAIRSAEAFGATGAIALRGTADPWSPKAVRASASSALRLPLLRGADAASVLKQLKAAGVAVVAATSHSHSGAGADSAEADADADGARNENEIFVDLRKPVALLIGSEGKGLPGDLLEAADATIAIPMTGDVESLNAGIAASILLYEAARQRRAGKL